MAPKTRRSNRKRRNTRRLRRGGGNKTDACSKYRLQGMKPSIPEPSKTNSISDESHTALLAALRAVPEEKILLLKVGSNDSPAAIQTGSKGENGVLFIEFPYYTRGDTALIDLNKAVPRALLQIHTRFLKDIGDTKIGLVAVSPEDSKHYNTFSYPFDKEDKTETTKTAILNLIYEKIDTRNYVETFFPLAPGSDKTNEILDLIVSRKTPVILFNAMGSYCYRSFKYINDMRKNADLLTIYMGLVDSATYSQCDIGSVIYPDPETSCA
jgi:hypothetical protein